jgi:TolA-binding protein
MLRVSKYSHWNRLAAVTLILFASLGPAYAANRHVIELQVRVGAMSDQCMIMQQSIDESFSAMAQSLEQSSAQLAASEKTLAKLQQAAPRNATPLGSLARQMATLTQSSSGLGAPLNQIERHMEALSTKFEQPTQAAVTAGTAAPPDVLFRNGMEDYEAGHYTIASQEFTQFVKLYVGTDQVALAQFYLADSEYWAGDYQAALNDFDKMEQQYPATKTATVELKKGFSLVKLGESEAAREEFRHVIERFPNSVEAMDARSALGMLPKEANALVSYPRR